MNATPKKVNHIGIKKGAVASIVETDITGQVIEIKHKKPVFVIIKSKYGERHSCFLNHVKKIVPR